MGASGFMRQDPDLTIREARHDEAAAACDLVRRSIVDLCHPDHGDDRGQLAVWLADKTPDNVRVWIAQSHVFVAERGGRMVGVGALTGAGEITLNHVAPEHRFSGVSRALLLGLEERARDLGLARLTVESTRTAAMFYAAAGYGAPEGPRGRGSPRRCDAERFDIPRHAVDDLSRARAWAAGVPPTRNEPGGVSC